MRWALGAFWAAVIGLLAAASHDIVAAGPQGLAPRAAPSSSSLDRTLLNKYCFSCHNSRLRTGGLALDSFDVSAVGEHADVWEKVVRKLRGGLMPPAGMPRPDKATQEQFVGWLETELDRASMAHPNPGRTEPFHRLNRFEYQNAVHDLLAL